MRNKKVSVTSANILFFIFVIAFLGFQFVLGFVNALFGGKLIDGNLYGILIINQYIFILLPVIIFAIVKKLDFKEVFRFNKFGIIPAGIIILLSLPAYFAAAMLNTFMIYLLQFIGKIPAQVFPVPQNIEELILGLLIIAVSPALCEEMLNRGIMLKAYENRGSIKAIVITATLFGVFHFDITNLLGPIFLGLLIGYYVIRTNSIFAAMLAHFMNNAIAEVFSYIFRDEARDAQYITISMEELGGSVVYGIAGLIVVWLLIKFFNRVTKDKTCYKPSISSVRRDVISTVSHWPIIVVLVLYALMTILNLVIFIMLKFQ